MLLSIQKKILVFTVIMLSASFVFAEDDGINIYNEESESNISDEPPQTDSAVNYTDGYFSFLESCINCNISIIIKDVDNSILGKLQKIYKDGVLLETSFNSTIFIPKDSIAYIKISKMNKK